MNSPFGAQHNYMNAWSSIQGGQKQMVKRKKRLAVLITELAKSTVISPQRYYTEILVCFML